jgi:hypothetical protein
MTLQYALENGFELTDLGMVGENHLIKIKKESRYIQILLTKSAIHASLMSPLEFPETYEEFIENAQKMRAILAKFAIEQL